MVRLAAILALSGCSFVVVKGPPRQPPRDRMAYCTSSALPMVVDVGLAVGVAYTTLAVLDEAGEPTGSRSEKALFWNVLAVGAGATAAMIISSVYGYRTSQRCNTYQLEQAARLNAQIAATAR
jgi:hypothetical protein